MFSQNDVDSSCANCGTSGDASDGAAADELGVDTANITAKEQSQVAESGTV